MYFFLYANYMNYMLKEILVNNFWFNVKKTILEKFVLKRYGS